MSTLRFLPGLLLVQAATIAALVFGTRGGAEPNWSVLAICALAVTLVVGLWFGSIAEHQRKDALHRVREEFARERERLKVAAEADKRTIVEQSHERIVRETNRAHARANFKLGVAVTAMVGIASVMIYAELLTLGLLTLTGAGGAVAGYIARARQDVVAARRRAEETLIEAHVVERPTTPAPKRQRPALGRPPEKA